MTSPFGDIPKSRLVIIGAVALIIVIVVIAFLQPQDSKVDPNLPKGSVRLTAWGLSQDADAFRALADAYKNSSQETKQYLVEFVEYASAPELESALVNALAENRGPDLFYFHNSWLLKHGAKTQPAYSALITPSEVAKLYPQTVLNDFMNTTASGTLVYALPLHMDGLGVIYNQDIMEASGVTFNAATWENLSWTDFMHVVQTTKQQDGGVITRAGTALGTAQNTSNASDILSALLLQSDELFLDAGGKISFGASAKNAFLFYLQFANRNSDNFTWENSSGDSREEFSKGNIAAIIDYHSALADIRGKNKFLDIRIVPFPQLSADASKKRTYTSYWGLAVSNFSKNKYVAWHFIKFATMHETANGIFLEKAQKLPALVTAINKLVKEGDQEAFLKSFFFARSWRQKNPDITKATFDALIENVNTGRLNIDQAMRSAQETLNQ